MCVSESPYFFAENTSQKGKQAESSSAIPNNSKGPEATAASSSSGRKMDLYRSNGVPHAYSDMAEEVQRGRDAKIAHLLKQVVPKSEFFTHKT